MDDGQIQNVALRKAFKQGGGMSATSLKSRKTAASTVGGNESTMAGEGGKPAGG